MNKRSIFYMIVHTDIREQHYTYLYQILSEFSIENIYCNTLKVHYHNYHLGMQSFYCWTTTCAYGRSRMASRLHFKLNGYLILKLILKIKFYLNMDLFFRFGRPFQAVFLDKKSQLTSTHQDSNPWAPKRCISLLLMPTPFSTGP